jgi:DNA-binding transcriptional LysR family regulator
MRKKHIDTAGILSLNLGSLDLYVRAIDAGSFSAVAMLLNMAPSSVSRQINQLELKLGGVALLNRTPKGLVPTEAGWQLYEIAKSLRQSWEGFQDELSESRHELRGTIRIGCPSTVGDSILPGMLTEFLARYPEVSVDMRVGNDYPDAMREKLDLVIYFGPRPGDNMVARKLCEGHAGLFASVDYLARHGEPQTMADLLEHNFLMYAHNGVPQPTLAYEYEGRQERITLKGHFIVDSSNTLLQMIASGAGIGLSIGWNTAPLVRQGVIREILTQYSDIRPPFVADSSVYAIFPDHRSMTTRVRVFLDELIDYLQNHRE